MLAVWPLTVVVKVTVAVVVAAEEAAVSISGKRDARSKRQRRRGDRNPGWQPGYSDRRRARAGRRSEQQGSLLSRPHLPSTGRWTEKKSGRAENRCRRYWRYCRCPRRMKDRRPTGRSRKPKVRR